MRLTDYRPLALIVLCTAFSAPVVYAQDATKTTTVPESESTPPARDSAAPVPMSFEELDANGDGAISKDEAAVDPALAQAFGTLDKDADGKLSAAEYAAYSTAGGGEA